jgi:uncharacterized protein YukE/xanthosine utilization system XapX-like protein
MDFWQVVGMIDRINREHGIPLPALKPVLEQFSLVDEARLRQAAAAWGTGGASVGIAGELSRDLPGKINDAIDTAAKRWQGEAYDSFQSVMDSLQGTIADVCIPAQEVGKVLEDLADAFELSWLEIIGLIGGIAGVVVGVIAMVAPSPPTVALAIVSGVVGLVLGYIGILVSIVSSLFPRVMAFVEAAETLAKDIEALIPAAPGSHTPERDAWKRKTVNPIN